MSDDISAGTTRMHGADGDEIEAYLAVPSGPTKPIPRGGVVVIHHLPGYDLPTKEITRRFATLGYAALMPNLYSREAPGADPSDAAAHVRALGGVPDARLVGDVEGAISHLQSLGAARVGAIGFCSGGRQSVLAACSLPLAAAVDCYGAYVVGDAPPDFPLPLKGLEPLLLQLSCPLLGLFGEDDARPSPDDVARLTALLDQHGKDFTPVSYPGAGHAFFSVDRVSYRPQAAVDGWERIEAFFGRHLAD